ncbi:hypothetical protein V8C40DRAFT_52347 [Trichoderma camerunense]
MAWPCLVWIQLADPLPASCLVLISYSDSRLCDYSRQSSGEQSSSPCFPSTPTQLFFSTAMVRCNTRLYSMGKQQPRQSEGWRPRTWHGSFTYSSFDTVPAAVQALHLPQV